MGMFMCLNDIVWLYIDIKAKWKEKAPEESKKVMHDGSKMIVKEPVEMTTKIRSVMLYPFRISISYSSIIDNIDREYFNSKDGKE